MNFCKGKNANMYIGDFFRDASAFQINKGTEKCVKYDIESFLSAFLQQLPVWIAL